MIFFLYSFLFLPFLRFFISLAALFSPRLRYGLKARKAPLPERPQGKVLYWFHAASVGEYDSVRVLAQKIKSDYPESLLLFTVFSDSALKQRANDSLPDFFIPLPIDFKRNVQRMIHHFSPKAVFYSRYDVWPNLSGELHKAGIPQFLVSAILREKSGRFRGLTGSLNRVAYSHLKRIFTVSQATADRFHKFGFTQTEVAGDTRADAIAEQISMREKDTEVLEKLKRIQSLLEIPPEGMVIVAGSTYPASENMLFDLAVKRKDIALIIAPHHINEKHLIKMRDMLKERNLQWSEFSDAQATRSRIVIADTMGILSLIYQLGDIAYVGGGFEGKVHNTLEPARSSLPVISGPHIDNAEESMAMKDSGLLYTLPSPSAENFSSLLVHAGKNQSVLDFYNSYTGATDRVYTSLKQQGLF